MEEPQSPRVTALVVSRNEAAALRACLQRLEASQDRERLEILAVDDGSVDETGDVLAEFPNLITLRIPKPIGWTRAVNIGLRTAKGDGILLMRPDCLVRPETITALADRLERDSEVGAVCPSAEQVWQFPTPDTLAAAWKTGTLAGATRPAGGDTPADYPKGSAILVRREYLRAMNFLDQRFGEYWADLEMCSRIRGGAKKILVLGDVAVDRQPLPPDTEDDLARADSANGVATWIGIHHGFAAGLRFRIGAAFYALGRGSFGLAMALLSGSKIDGNQ